MKRYSYIFGDGIILESEDGDYCKFSDHQQALAAAEGRVKAAMTLLDYAKCPECDGSGITIHERTVGTCCNQPLETGECCGNPVAALEQYQEQCQWCSERADLRGEALGEEGK